MIVSFPKELRKQINRMQQNLAIAEDEPCKSEMSQHPKKETNQKFIINEMNNQSVNLPNIYTKSSTHIYIYK